MPGVRPAVFGRTRRRTLRRQLCLAALVAIASRVEGAVFRVGVGVGCTHATADAAFAAADANAEADQIDLVGGLYDLAGTIEITGDDVVVQGGFASCGDLVPSGTTLLRAAGAGADVFYVHGPADTRLRLERVTVGHSVGVAGRGLRIEAGANVELAASSVADGEAARGGNILLSDAGTLLEIFDGSAILRGAATTDHGGGIYCEDGATIEGSGAFVVADNEAFDSGGGAYLDNCDLDLFPSSPAGSVVPDGGFSENTALHGDGGGIAAVNGSTVEIKNNDWDFVAWLWANEAPEGAGGGLYLEDAGTQAILRSVQVVENVAGGPGGGIFVTLGATLSMQLGYFGECQLGSTCSAIAGNRSTGSGAGGLGVTDGASATVLQTLIARNFNVGDFGGAAVGAYGAATSLTLEGCQLWDNDPGGGTGTLTSRIFAGNSAAVTVAFSTVVEDAGSEGVFEVANASSVRFLSSIAQGAQVFLPVQPPATQVDCVVVPESASLPISATTWTVVTDPATLFVLATPEDFSLRRHSVAQDYCDTLVYSPLGADLDGEGRGYDDATEANVWGPYDLGADEWTPRLFADGFEDCGTCRWSAGAP